MVRPSHGGLNFSEPSRQKARRFTTAPSVAPRIPLILNGSSELPKKIKSFAGYKPFLPLTWALAEVESAIKDYSFVRDYVFNTAKKQVSPPTNLLVLMHSVMCGVW